MTDSSALSSPVSPALETNPFTALEAMKPEVAERIALAFCYARDRWELGACLGYGDRIGGRIEYFAVKSATISWFDGAVLAPFVDDRGIEGLDSRERFDALQGMAWDYLDALDKRDEAARRAEKVG